MTRKPEARNPIAGSSLYTTVTLSHTHQLLIINIMFLTTVTNITVAIVAVIATLIGIVSVTVVIFVVLRLL